VAQTGFASALKQDAKRVPGKNNDEARQEAEMTRLRAVIAESTVENLELQKDMKLKDLSEIPAESKAEVIRIVMQTQPRSDRPARRTWRQPEQLRAQRAGPIAAARAHRKSVNQQRYTQAVSAAKSPVSPRTFCPS
jgi:hypothetical protein